MCLSRSLVTESGLFPSVQRQCNSAEITGISECFPPGYAKSTVLVDLKRKKLKMGILASYFRDIN